MFYSRMMPTEQNMNEILKRTEEGYLKTNPIAKEYLILSKKTHPCQGHHFAYKKPRFVRGFLVWRTPYSVLSSKSMMSLSSFLLVGSRFMMLIPVSASTVSGSWLTMSVT